MPYWNELAETYLQSLTERTECAYREGLKQFFRFVELQPDEVQPAHVMQFCEHLRAAGRSEGTVGLRIAAVRGFYGFLLQPSASGDQLIQRNPAAGIRMGHVEKYGRARKIQLEDFKRLLRAGNPRMRAYLWFHVMTGRRRAEVARLVATDLEIRGDVTWFRYIGKGGKIRWRELPSVVVDALKVAGLLPAPPEGTIWRVTEGALIKALKRLAKKAGVNVAQTHCHALRHLATELRRLEGADIEELREFLDHSSASITALYLERITDRRDVRASNVARKIFE